MVQGQTYIHLTGRRAIHNSVHVPVKRRLERGYVMLDGANDIPESAVRRVARLTEGEAYSIARYIPAFRATPQTIRAAKRELSQYMSPIVARARLLSYVLYRTHTIHAFSKDYDVIVSGVIVREAEPDTTKDTRNPVRMTDITERCGC